MARRKAVPPPRPQRHSFPGLRGGREGEQRRKTPSLQTPEAVPGAPCSCPSWPVNGDPPEAVLSWRTADGSSGVALCAFSEAALRWPGPHPTRTWRALPPLRQAHSRSCTCGRYSTLLLQKSGLPRLYLMSLETHPFKGYLLALGPPGTNLPWVDFGVSLVGD